MNAKIAACLALLPLAGCKSSGTTAPALGGGDAAIVGNSDSATSAAVGASDAALGPAFGAPPSMGPGGGPGMGGPGCQPTVLVVSTASACSHGYPSEVTVTWSCTFPDGGAFTGNDDVKTTLTPDACPPTSVGVEQQMTLAESRSHADHIDSISGSSTADFSVLPPPPPTPGSTPMGPPPPSSRSVSFDLHAVSSQAGNTVHDAQITGTRTVAFSDGGTVMTPADDSVVIDGVTDIADSAQDAKVNLTDAGITRVMSCCHPTAGTSSFSLGDLDDPSAPLITHSITFGPACGQATREDGTAVTLPSCPMGPMGPGGGPMNP